MHQRTWLSLLTFPLVTTFTAPMVLQQAPPAAQVDTAKTVQDPLAGLADIQDVLRRVQDSYVDVPDMEKVISGGIEAALERAHPLNAYLTPEEVRLPDPGPAQVGLMVIKKGIYGQIAAVVPGSPADKAGLQVGDVIRKLDGDSIGSMSAWELERRLKGTPGSDLELLTYDTATGQLKKVPLKREVIKRPAITLRKDPKAAVVSLPDLTAGRAAELKTLLAGLDRKQPLVLDLRNCAGGELSEAAQVAGLFVTANPLATIQEAGKPDRVIPVAKEAAAGFAAVGVFQGIGTVGAGEALSSCLKKQSIPLVGDRTAGLGVERTRILLKQGSAVELVTRRWLGAGGEKLDRQGVQPDDALKGLQPGEDPLPKALELLLARWKKAA